MGHLKNLQVKNFKGIKDLELKQLNLINFLVGESGTSKTTMLEAISILEDPLNIGRFADVVRLKDRNKYVLSSFKELIHGTYKPIVNNGFDLFFNDKHVEFKLKFQKENKVLIKLMDENDSVIDSYERDTFPIYRMLTDRFFERRKTSKDSLIINTSLSLSRDINYEKLLSIPIIVDTILTILQFVNPQIERLSFSKKDKNIVVFDKNLNKNIPIELVGDGIKDVINLFILIVYSENSILLLEDWDKSFSKKIKRILFPVVKKLIVELNVQIFFTTYSEDTLSYMIDKEDPLTDNVMIYTFYKEKGENYVRRLNGDDAFRAFNEYGLSLMW